MMIAIRPQSLFGSVQSHGDGLILAATFFLVTVLFLVGFAAIALRLGRIQREATISLVGIELTALWGSRAIAIGLSLYVSFMLLG